MARGQCREKGGVNGETSRCTLHAAVVRLSTQTRRDAALHHLQARQCSTKRIAYPRMYTTGSLSLCFRVAQRAAAAAP